MIYRGMMLRRRYNRRVIQYQEVSNSSAEVFITPRRYPVLIKILGYLA
jgi:hypothetical protein